MSKIKFCFLLTAILSLFPLTASPASSNQDEVLLSTAYADWSFALSGRNTPVFLTNTNYNLSFNWKVRATPPFRTIDSRYSGCIFRPDYETALNDPEAGYTRPIVWFSKLNIEVTNRNESLRLNDRYELEDPFVINLEMWIDNLGFGHPDGYESFRNHFQALSNGVVTRPAVKIQFPEPGEYFIQYQVETSQLQKPTRMGPPSNCFQSTQYQILESTKSQKFLVKVEDRQKYEQKQKQIAKNKKKKKIICIKGKSRLEVSGTKPVCPSGYVKK